MNRLMKKWRLRSPDQKVGRPDLTRIQVIERLGVEWDNPVLEGVLWVLANIEDEAQMLAVDPLSKRKHRKEAVVMMGAAIEAQRQMREMVGLGRKKMMSR